MYMVTNLLTAKNLRCKNRTNITSLHFTLGIAYSSLQLKNELLIKQFMFKLFKGILTEYDL